MLTEGDRKESEKAPARQRDAFLHREPRSDLWTAIGLSALAFAAGVLLAIGPTNPIMEEFAATMARMVTWPQ